MVEASQGCRSYQCCQELKASRVVQNHRTGSRAVQEQKANQEAQSRQKDSQAVQGKASQAGEHQRHQDLKAIPEERQCLSAEASRRLVEARRKTVQLTKGQRDQRAMSASPQANRQSLASRASWGR
jgi:hypothetical protein